MKSNRQTKAASHGNGRIGSQNRELLVGTGVAVCLALLVIGGLYLFGRGESQSSTTNSHRATIQTLADGSMKSSAVPAPLLDDDQRIFATRTPQKIEDRNGNGQTPAAESSRETADANAVSQESLPATPPSGVEQEEESNNPRKLLRKARRQIKAGEGLAALGTSRKIVALVDNVTGRSEIEDKIAEAEAAAEAGQNVDFDSLIQLIESVISPNSWSSVGGAGTVESFAGGVYVATGGLVKPRSRPEASTELGKVRDDARPAEGRNGEAGQTGLRKISLPRLEKEVASRLARGEPLSEEIRYLAGLQEVRYVFVFPEEHDIVVVGPAEEWQMDEFGRAVGRHSGRPVMQLEDLVVILRSCFSDSKDFGLFGCGIYPRTERLQQVQEFLARSAAAGPIEPSQRNRWLGDLRDQLGPQDIEIFGIHPGSRVAHVLVEADYRMKLIGIGLEQASVPGIPSYFDLLGQPDDARLNRPIDTLRWWFTLNYDAILTSDDRDAFELRGDRVQVLSENELLTATGQRVHTGQSDPSNAQFARNFTEHFRALSNRDVNFADLAGIFDSAVVAGLLRGHEIPKSVGWPMSTFLDPDEFVISLNPSPRTVETVMSHRVYRGRHIMAAISGGVHVNPWKVVSADRLLADTEGKLVRLRSGTKPTPTAGAQWWWD